MAIIKEDYVSFETAKLLKEKGFNEPCYTCYLDKELSHYEYLSSNFELIDGVISAPTLQMAMKWLREAHKLHITILWDCGAYIGKNSFRYHIDRMNNYEDKEYNKIGFDSNEEAVEAAIKYCLEKLI